MKPTFLHTDSGSIALFAILLSACMACGGKVPVDNSNGASDLGSTVDGGSATWAAPQCSADRVVVTLWSGTTAINDTEYNVAVNATDVYWTASTPGSAGEDVAYGDAVMSVPVDGGAVRTIATDLPPPSSYPDNPVTLTLDSSSVYWSTIMGLVMKAPLNGGPLTMLFDGTGVNQNTSGGLAVSSGDVYALSNNLQGDPGAALSLVSFPTAGGVVSTIGTSPVGGSETAGSVAVDTNNVYWTDVVSMPGATGCNGGCILSTYEMLVLSAPRAGGTVTTLATTPASVPQARTNAIAVDESSVYFTSDGAMASVAIGGGAVTTIASSPPVTHGFAMDEANLYWGSGEEVAKVAKNGGPVTTLCGATGGQVLACAVDATSVYCLSAAAGVDAQHNSGFGLVKIAPK